MVNTFIDVKIMKTLNNYIDESLIKSYNHNLLIKKLKTKYNIYNINEYDSKSNLKSFVFNINEEITDDNFLHLLDFYGYYCSEICKDTNNIFLYYIEPVFSEKCTDKVYNESNGKIYHITNITNLSNILRKGIKPSVGKNYRVFSERAFFVYGKTNDEIIKNVSHIIKEKRFNYTIIEIDISKYKVNFYYDTSENKQYNCIYSNNIFFPHLLNEIGNIDDLKEHLKINESQYINTKYGKLYVKNI